MGGIIAKYGDAHGIAIDVGAHIGYHSLKMADHFAIVFALEPDPITFGYLHKNTGKKGNVKCINAAASSVDNDASLSRDTISTRSTLMDTKDGVNVRARSLDSLTLDGTLPVSFIKMDVEGHEVKVLQGATNLLRTRRPVIVYEDHTGATTSFLLRNFAFYRVQQINPTNYLALPQPC